jgi:hypothetical protein
MADFEPGCSGSFCWYELTTQNTDAAKPFYAELFGWKLEPSKLSPVPYDEIHIDDRAVGGMLRIDESWGENWDKIPPHWMTYITVDNCDATVEAITANGGGVCVPPFDAPNVGRIAVCNEPSGATFSIVQFAMPS